jgi:Leucine-rich repeat (LRR) protein
MENSETLKELFSDSEELELNGLPDGIFRLTSLKKLKLSGITELPDAIGNLVSLQELDLSFCKITKLPESIGNLHALKKLDLSSSKILSLPKTIGNLSNLEELDFSNTPVETLPAGMVNLKSLAVNRIKNIKLVRLIQFIVRKLSKKFNFIISLQKFAYSYMYRRLDTFQQKLDVCGWHSQRGIFVCRRNSNRCCSAGGTCGYAGPGGCTVDSLSCKFWICEKAMDYLCAIKSDRKHPLRKTCARYLRMRISFDAICHALDIPLKGRASKFDNFDINNTYRENTDLERWFDNIYLRPFGQFISSREAETERISSLS